MTSREAEDQKWHQHKLDILAMYGDDSVFPDGYVIRFYKLFKEGDVLYPYFAGKADGYWYIGGQPHRFSWVDFIDFFEANNLLDARVLFGAGSDAWESIYEFDD